MKRKMFLFILILIMLMNQNAFLEVIKISEIPRSHWVYPIAVALEKRGIINNSSTVEIGSRVKFEEFLDLIAKVESASKLKNSYNIDLSMKNSKLITRQEAVEMCIQYLGYDWMAQQLKTTDIPFKDVASSKGYLKLAQEFNLISTSGDHFRPKEALTIEEAFAMIYHLDRLKQTNIALLHSYYAINSFSQINKIKDLDSLSFGWSRIEYSKIYNDIILNSSSTNGNEYRVPTGYNQSIELAEQSKISKQLMITIRDEMVYNAELKNEISLTEQILLNKEMSSRSIDLIIKALSNNSQGIKYNGVLIDFEELKGKENATRLNLFLSNLKVALDKEDIELMVAVHPSRKPGLVYYDGYDFKSIGRLADYVIVMVHDFYPKKLTKLEMKSGFTITPLTAINDLYYALEGITNSETGIADRSKIIIQFSIDSVQWKLSDGEILNETPYHPNYATISNRIKNGVEISYSDSVKSPFIIFASEDDKTRNIVWYEDKRSIQSKIDMTKYFGIDKISIWRLGVIPDIKDISSEKPQYLDIWSQLLLNKAK